MKWQDLPYGSCLFLFQVVLAGINIFLSTVTKPKEFEKLFDLFYIKCAKSLNLNQLCLSHTACGFFRQIYPQYFFDAPKN